MPPGGFVVITPHSASATVTRDTILCTTTAAEPGARSRPARAPRGAVTTLWATAAGTEVATTAPAEKPTPARLYPWARPVMRVATACSHQAGNHDKSRRPTLLCVFANSETASGNDCAYRTFGVVSGISGARAVCHVAVWNDTDAGRVGGNGLVMVPLRDEYGGNHYSHGPWETT